jgi:hypothetical protein
MSSLVYISAGLFLFILLATEESSRALAWVRDTLARRPGLKLLAYPLAALMGLAAAALIINAFVNLALSLTFSYD